MHNEQLDSQSSDAPPTSVSGGLLGLLLLSAISIGGAVCIGYGIQWLIGF
jgi:hypothetical protein